MEKKPTKKPAKKRTTKKTVVGVAEAVEPTPAAAPEPAPRVSEPEPTYTIKIWTKGLEMRYDIFKGKELVGSCHWDRCASVAKRMGHNFKKGAFENFKLFRHFGYRSR